MSPRVLISDALSPAAVQIFKDRGVEVDFQPNLGKDKDKLAAAIDGFDGLAIRSATKVTAKTSGKGEKLESDRPRRHRRRQCRYSGCHRARNHRHEHAVRQFDHHRRTCHYPDAVPCAANPRGRRVDASRQVGEKQDSSAWRFSSKTLGIIGCGNIGSIVADRAIGLKMKVIAYDPYLVGRARAQSRRREGRARRAVAPR